MRKLFLGLFAAVLCVGVAAAETVEVKGPHICCKACVKAVDKMLSAVQGVSDIKADIKSKTVTFTAKDEKAAKAGVKALVDGGLFGKVTCDTKEMKVEVPAPTGAKADVVVVKDVHVCCGQCQNGVKAAFKDAKVTFEGSGAQRTVRIEATGLEPAAVLEALHKAGFNGNVQK